jgi:4-azaleucine resistance transporter AzlC
MENTVQRQEFLSGARDASPILLGVIPFGMIFGALAVTSGLSTAAAQAMSSVVFAGSAQFIAAQLLGADASGFVVLMVVFIVNLRHVLYSASVAPHVDGLRPGWKFVLAYLLTDEAYAVIITHYNNRGDARARHWYFLGAGLTLWVSWQLSTAAGIIVGAQIPRNWPLGFVLPITFIALVVPALKDGTSVAAAVIAGTLGLLAGRLPYKTGIIVAALVGITVGMLVESRKT